MKIPPSNRNPEESDPDPCDAVVTRYPAGCFGITYKGNMFHWWGFMESDAITELEKINPSRVKWEERLTQEGALAFPFWPAQTPISAKAAFSG